MHQAGLETIQYNGAEVPTFNELRNIGEESALSRTMEAEIKWKRMGFDWPFWVLFIAFPFFSWFVPNYFLIQSDGGFV